MLSEIRAGQTVLADGTVAPARASRIGATVACEGQGKYYESTSRGNIFSLMLTATTGAIAAGNVWGGNASTATQFALWNPLGSGKNLSLLKFSVWTISGTAPVPPVVHSYSTTIPTATTSVVTPIACNNAGMSASSVARAFTSAASAGAALAGASTAVSYLRAADLAVGAGVLVPANTFETKSTEYIDGDIVLAPGTFWVPTWGSAAACLWGASITWEEIPV